MPSLWFLHVSLIWSYQNEKQFTVSHSGASQVCTVRSEGPVVVSEILNVVAPSEEEGDVATMERMRK